MKPLRSLSSVAVVLLALFTFSASEAAKLPPWAADIADSAPEIRQGGEDNWLILLSLTSIELQPPDSMLITKRLAAQAQSDNACEMGIGRYQFTSDSKIKKARAWHLPPGRKARKSRGPAIDITFDSSFLTDSQVRYVPLHGIEEGSLAFFEFEVIEQPHALTYAQLLYEGEPVDVARIEVKMPSGWRLQHDWACGENARPVTESGATIWVMENLPGETEMERLGEPAVERAPMLVMAFLPPEQESAGVSGVMEDWPAMALWWEELAAGSHECTPEIKAAAESVLAEAGKDRLDRIRALSIHVRDSVRYLSRSIGVGGYRPRPASEVLRELIGDCKDKGTLLRSMLAADGTESYPVIINATRSRTVSEDVASLSSFNHFIIGASLPAGLETPEQFEQAVLEVEGIGRLLMIDPTDEYTAIGTLPAALAGKRALLVAGERSRLIKLPGTDPAAHRAEFRISTEILKQDKISIAEEIMLFGEPARNARGAWFASAQEYKKDTVRELDSQWPGALVDAHEVEAEQRTGHFMERVEWTAEIPPDSKLLSLFPDALAYLPRVSLRKRETPVVYPHAITVQVNSSVRGAPPETRLPADRDLAGEGWSIETRFSRDEDVVRATWKLLLEKRRYEPDEFEALRELWLAARKSAAAAIYISAPAAD